LYSDDEDNQLSQTSDSLSQSQPDKPAEQQKKDFTESPEELEQREQIQNKLKREREKKKKKQNASKKKGGLFEVLSLFRLLTLCDN